MLLEVLGYSICLLCGCIKAYKTNWSLRPASWLYQENGIVGSSKRHSIMEIFNVGFKSECSPWARRVEDFPSRMEIRNRRPGFGHDKETTNSQMLAERCQILRRRWGQECFEERMERMYRPEPTSRYHCVPRTGICHLLILCQQICSMTARAEQQCLARILPIES